MSKIFEALQKTQGEIAKQILEVVGEGSLRGSESAGEHTGAPASAAEEILLASREMPGDEKESLSHESTSPPQNPPADFVASGQESGSLSQRLATELFWSEFLPVAPTAERVAKEPPTSSSLSHETAPQPLDMGGREIQPAAESAIRHGLESNAGDSSPDTQAEMSQHLSGKSASSDWMFRSAPIRLDGEAPLLPFDTAEGMVAAEQYRLIRTKLMQHRLRPRLVLVSSAEPGDGKSVTAINIAGALALNRELKVL